MEKFKDFVQKNFGCKFIGLMYDTPTQVGLRDFCLSNNIDLTKSWSGATQAAEAFQFHTTIYYTNQPVERALPDGEYNTTVIETTPSHYELLGPENNCLTICLKQSPELDALRAMFREKYHCYDKWPVFKPHITLSYNATEIPKDLPLPTVKLIGWKLEVHRTDG